MNDWAEIRRLHGAACLSQSAIAKRLSVSRTTVARALASPVPKMYSRPPRASKFDDVEYGGRAGAGVSGYASNGVGGASGHGGVPVVVSETFRGLSPRDVPGGPC